MKKRFYSLYLIFLFLLLLFPLACKSPETPELPPKYADIIEFMYKRTKPVLDNNSTDPQGFTIWNGAMGGWAIRRLTYLGDNQWMGAISLAYNKEAPFWIYTLDGKVTGGKYETVAETFYARVQGTSEWKELTCVEVEPYSVQGLAAKFWLYDGVITIP